MLDYINNGCAFKFDGEDLLVPVEKNLSSENIDNFIEKLISVDMVDDAMDNT